MKRLWLILVLLAVFLPASADKLYIRNQLYKGITNGSGLDIQAELGPLVEALGLKLTEVSSNWVITKAGETPSLPEGESGAGKVYYEGKALCEASDPSSMVSVNKFAQATGSVLKPNKGSGTVDLVREMARIVETAPQAKKARPQNEGYSPNPKFRIIAFDAVW